SNCATRSASTRSARSRSWISSTRGSGAPWPATRTRSDGSIAFWRSVRGRARSSKSFCAETEARLRLGRALHRAAPAPSWLRRRRGQIPLVAEGVAHGRAPLAVRLQCRRLHRRRARRERAAVPGIHVVDVDVEHRGEGLPLIVRLAHLDDRAADANLGV